jgi:hypothetical protein
MKIYGRVLEVYEYLHTFTSLRWEKQPPILIVWSHTRISLKSVQKMKISALPLA